MDLLYSQRFDAFSLISSDSDFTSLATRLREYEIHVMGFGKAIAPTSFENADVDIGEVQSSSNQALIKTQNARYGN